jgi:hypothetical protein
VLRRLPHQRFTGRQKTAVCEEGFAVTKFLVLYKSSATAAEQMAASDPAAAQEAMGLWMAWMEKAGPAIVDGGSPLGDPTVLPSGGGQGERQVGGYSILQGESLEEINKLLDGHPHFHSPNASIEVRECLSMPGMS